MLAIPTYGLAAWVPRHTSRFKFSQVRCDTKADVVCKLQDSQRETHGRIAISDSRPLTRVCRQCSRGPESITLLRKVLRTAVVVGGKSMLLQRQSLVYIASTFPPSGATVLHSRAGSTPIAPLLSPVGSCLAHKQAQIGFLSCLSALV